jgi:aminoacylase
MKSIGVAHYFALKTIRESKIKLNKTVHLSIVPDEEKGGTKGTKLFIETEVFKKLNIGFVIDEGIASGDTSKLFIKVNERRPVQIKISVYTPGGHASRLQSKNCLHELIHILNKIVRLQNKQQKKAKNAESGAYDSFNITSISYAPFSSKSSAFNVIPDEASAIVDIRRSPTTALETILKLIEKVTKSNGNATVALCAVAQDAKEPRPDITELYKYMSNAIAKNSLKPEPFIFEATTDLRFYQDRGIPGIGITPFTCNPALHQNNEYIRLNDILLGITIFKDFLTDFGTDIQQETHV